MKQNFKRFLNEEKHKLDQGMSNEIYNEVFSVSDGLLAAKNLEDFMARRIVFENKYILCFERLSTWQPTLFFLIPF